MRINPSLSSLLWGLRAWGHQPFGPDLILHNTLDFECLFPMLDKKPNC